MNAFKLRLHKLFNWEYWPMEAIYFPLLPVWLFYALKSKSLFFFNAANPSIKNGGMAMESKKEIYDIIPPQYIPKTLLVLQDMDLEKIMAEINLANITFPLIVKPDIGMKALGVERIHDQVELANYKNKFNENFLIQELINYPNEIGIFYVRHPFQDKGKITGIVSKKFLAVIGNGTDTILQLILKNPRSGLQLNQLKRKFGDTLNTVLSEGEQFVLVPYGSHTRGAEFTDISNHSNELLVDTIHNICVQIPEFYFGRLDIRYNNFEELCAGKNFSIIEINGAGSEPTHIYDPRHSLFFAWKEIIRHWKYLFEISEINYQKGHRYLSYSEGKEMLRANNKLETKLKLL